MKKTVFAFLFLAAPAGMFAAATNSAPNAAAGPHKPPLKGTISLQEMLVIGPSNMKLHALTMISRYKKKGEVDASFFPGFEACAKDPGPPVRAFAARLIAKYYIEGVTNPPPQAVSLIEKLSKDSTPDVRYSAVFYGLCNIRPRSEALLHRLIELAAAHPDPALYQRILKALGEEQDRVVPFLEKKIQEGDNVALYEIYEDLVGHPPPNAEKYLAMPCSRPCAYVFPYNGKDPETFRAELEKRLKEAGLSSPNIRLSPHAAILKIYITRDRHTVDEKFASGPLHYTQTLWLSPQLEAQFNNICRRYAEQKKAAKKTEEKKK